MARWRRVTVVFACCLLLAPVDVHAADAAAPPPGAEADTSSTLVASAAPVPEQPATQGRAPRIGPFRGTADAGVGAATWLLVFGGVQVAALMFVTRRARSRVRVRDVEP